MIPEAFKTNPLQWSTLNSKAQIEYILTEMPPAERGPFINRLKPGKYKTQLLNRKGVLERQGEYTDLKTYRDQRAKVSDARKVQKQITASTRKVFIDANKANLIEAFETHQKQDAIRKNNIKLLFAKLHGVQPVDYGHEVSLGRGDTKLLKQPYAVALGILKGQLTPTTPLSDSGSDPDAIIQSRRENIRLSDNPLVDKKLLQYLNRPTNQREAAINFLLNRPDLNKNKLSINEYLADSIKMNKLMTGEINVDQLEMQNLLETELKNAGVFKEKPTKQNQKSLKQLVNRAHTLDLVKSASDTTPSKKRFDITTKERGDITIDQWERTRQSKIPNPNPKRTILPSEATGRTQVNRPLNRIVNKATSFITNLEIGEWNREVKTDSKLKRVRNLNRNMSKFKGTGLGSYLTNETDNTFIDLGGYAPPIRYIGKDFNVNL